MSKRLLIICIIISLSFLWATQASFVDKLSIGGNIGGVVRSSDGIGLSDIEIRVYRENNQVSKLHTCSRGEYVIHSLPSGKYMLEFWDAEGNNTRRGVKVSDARNSFCNIELDASVQSNIKIELKPSLQQSIVHSFPPSDSTFPPIPVSGAYVSPNIPPFEPEPFLAVESGAFFEVDTHASYKITYHNDTAYFSYLRRILTDGIIPAPESVRISEMINYMSPMFDSHQEPGFVLHSTLQPHPFNKEGELLSLTLKAPSRKIAAVQPMNLIAVLDCSGRMGTEHKLYLARECLRYVIENMKDTDQLRIVCAKEEPSQISIFGNDKLKAFSALDAIGATGKGDIAAAMEIAINLGKEAEECGILIFGDGVYSQYTIDSISQSIISATARGLETYILGIGRGLYRDDQLKLLAHNSGASYIYLDGIQEFQQQFRKRGAFNDNIIGKNMSIMLEFDLPSSIKKYRVVGIEHISENRNTIPMASISSNIYADQEITFFVELEKRQASQVLTKLGRVMLQYYVEEEHKPRYEEFRIDAKSAANINSLFKPSFAAAAFGMLLGEEQGLRELNYDNLLHYMEADDECKDLRNMIEKAMKVKS